MLAVPLTSCATATSRPSVVCPPAAAYDRGFQARLADEMQRLPRMHSARIPCGTTSSSISPARKRPSNTQEPAWCGKEQVIFRTRRVFNNAAGPASPLPALLETMVRSLAPWAIRASTRWNGMPAVPKPPTRMVEPSAIPDTASSTDAKTLLIIIQALLSTTFHSTSRKGLGRPKSAARRGSSTVLKSAIRLFFTPNTASSFSHGQSGVKICVMRVS